MGHILISISNFLMGIIVQNCSTVVEQKMGICVKRLTLKVTLNYRRSNSEVSSYPGGSRTGIRCAV